jgi:hypothetical protein
MNIRSPQRSADWVDLAMASNWQAALAADMAVDAAAAAVADETAAADSAAAVAGTP